MLLAPLLAANCTGDKLELIKGITVLLWVIGGAVPLAAAWRLAHIFIDIPDDLTDYIADIKGMWNRFFRRVPALLLVILMEFAILSITQDRLPGWLGC